MMSASDAPPASARPPAAPGAPARGRQAGVRALRPTAVTEKSLMESVAGFINEVQAINLHGGTGSRDPKVNVTWARFEVADINDIRLFPDGGDVNGNTPPLLLILGYTQGVQIWLIPQTGDAQELLSWKQGVVKTLRLLPSPETRPGVPDNYAHCRPLICLADSTGPTAPFSTAKFISLKSGEQAHYIKFNGEIVELAVNKHVVVATLKEKLAVFEACNFVAKFHISFCYPSNGVDPNPIALGDRWMAYSDKRFLHIHKSSGGYETDSTQSMAAWGINVGSKLAQGVSRIYSNFFTSGGANPSSSPSSSRVAASPTSMGGAGGTGGGPSSLHGSGPQKGIVTVLDLLAVPNADGDELPLLDRIPGVIAHFIAHNKAIAAMKFDSTGSLILTCDSAGHYFHLFRIFPFPSGSSYSAVHHLYTLYRGDTPGSVQDIAFSSDNRLVAVSTLRGTTHIFPITPYGGPVGVRTHTAPRVVNRLSRFHRSAGIDEHRSTTTSSGRNSPNPNALGTSPVSSSLSKLSLGSIDIPGMSGSGPPLIVPYPNPYIPPFTNPTMVQPIAQLRQPYIVTLTNQTLGSASSAARKKSLSSPSGAAATEDVVSVRLAVTFAPPRAWLVGTQHHMFNRQQQKRAHESLFVMANHGVLLEYTLDVTPDSTLPKEKICESSPIELHVTAHGQWALTQPRDLAQLQPPLPIDSPLMLPIPGLKSYSQFGAGGSDPFDDSDDEDRWLSQVEITTHVGPHRRLWMGPQFSFKTLLPSGEAGEQQIVDLDVNLASRPDQSTPMSMPQAIRPSGHGRVPVLIEASSASSFELSPRFTNPFASRHPSSSSAKDTMTGQMDLEHELQEAMSETVGPDDSLEGMSSKRKSSSARGSIGSGGSGSSRRQQHQQEDEEFFCLTPEDCRSAPRSRNASATSQTSAAGKFSSGPPSYSSLPVQMETPDTKIFSVAVEARKEARGNRTSDNMRVCSVDTSGRSGQVAVVSSKESPTDESKKTPLAKEKASTKEMSGQPILTAVTTAPTSTESSASGVSSKKGKKKNKKKQQASKSYSSSEDTQNQTEEKESEEKPEQDLLDFSSLASTASIREVTPRREEKASPMPKPMAPSVRSAMETVEKTKSVAEALEEATVEVDNSADEFLPARRGTVTSEEEKDDGDDKSSSSPSFVVREPPQDDDEEDEEQSIQLRPDSSSAKPPLSGWLSAVLNKSEASDAIVKGIQSSEKKWEARTSDENSSSKDEQNMTSSTGFSLSASSLRKSAVSSAQDDSSEDDFDFRPAFSKKQKKKQSQKVVGSSEDSIRSRTGSFADSESSLPPLTSTTTTTEEDGAKSAPALLSFDGAKDDCKEGWSFEADDLDVDKLIDEVVGRRGSGGEANSGEKEEEEKTPLEDVFKFDSEMAVRRGEGGDDEDEVAVDVDDEGSDDDCETSATAKKKVSLSLENLKKSADCDDEDAEGASAATGGKSSSKAMSTSLNVKFDEDSLASSGGGNGGSKGGHTSESSVGSSPNPRKNAKGKKKKKKRTF